MNIRHHIQIFLFLMLFAHSAFSAEDCLNYGTTVTLHGHVVLRTFYGPPNYGEHPETDSRETQAILLLGQPICTLANPRNYEDAEKNQKEITLVPPLGSGFSRYSGQRVSVDGTLFHAHTGHHRTSLLMSVKNISEGEK